MSPQIHGVRSLDDGWLWCHFGKRHKMKIEIIVLLWAVLKHVKTASGQTRLRRAAPPHTPLQVLDDNEAFPPRQNLKLKRIKVNARCRFCADTHLFLRKCSGVIGNTRVVTSLLPGGERFQHRGVRPTSCGAAAQHQGFFYIVWMAGNILYHSRQQTCTICSNNSSRSKILAVQYQTNQTQ